MAKRQFKTESKRILELMVNSIYTHREIFLRELISNASDATDKRAFIALTDESARAEGELAITITIDKDARTLKISDNGCGMTKEELSENLGIIAKSGTLAFRRENEMDENMIGQFGVGFYSAFMVAKRVTVVTRALGSDTAYRWQSDGADGYTIDEAEKPDYGTDITLTLKDNEGEDNYDEFLSESKISALVKRYSDYVRYPIRMEMDKMVKNEETDKYENQRAVRTINSMTPIWKKSKADVSEDEYNSFYSEQFFDYQKPLCHLLISAEGTVCYKALLYIPAKAPFNYYTKDWEKGLRLYADGVLIEEKCGELLPDCFGFVRGCVDTSDLSLNISREMLQHDRQLKFIANNIEKKIKAELERMMKDDREKYEQFFDAFGTQLKYGCYADYGMKKDALRELLLFKSLKKDGKLISLSEYRAEMPEEQKYIYYANGEPARVSNLPQTEGVLEQGFDILCLTEEVDEFTLKMLHDYDEKELRSISAADKDVEKEETDEEKAAAEEAKPLLDAVKEALEGKVADVRLSIRLKSRPVCLAAEGELSLEMEKVLSQMPSGGMDAPKATRILELNPSHPVYEKLKAFQLDGATEEIKSYATLLYDQALLIEGLPIDDPTEFTAAVAELMAR